MKKDTHNDGYNAKGNETRLRTATKLSQIPLERCTHSPQISCQPKDNYKDQDKDKDKDKDKARDKYKDKDTYDNNDKY